MNNYGHILRVSESNTLTTARVDSNHSYSHGLTNTRSVIAILGTDRQTYFNMRKTAAESHRILMEVYSEHALAERTRQKWFARFKSGDFGLEDKERPGEPKKFDDEKLEALLDEDCCQTLEELAESLGVTQAAISKHLKAAGYIQMQGNWLPHELKPRDVERRFCMSEMLLERHKKKSFLHRVVTVDEK